MKLNGQLLLIIFSVALIHLNMSGTQAQNLALGKPAYTSSNYSSSYGGNKAVDGTTSISSKWTSANISGNHWIYIDLQANHDIGSITVKHAGSAGEPDHFNTEYYQIQRWNGSSWTIEANVNNLSQQKTTSTNVSFNTRYVLINVTNPGIDNIARIPEVEVYAASTSNVVLSSSGDSHLAWPYPNSQINCSNKLAGTDGWLVTCSTGCGAHVNSDYYADDWVTVNYNTCNTPFYSPISGTVIYAGWSTVTDNDGGDWNYGRQVVIRSDQNATFAFRVSHLESMAVSEGQSVSTGTTLGNIGTTGNSTGCHAHTVLYRNLTQSAVNVLDVGGYLSSSTYAAPFYYDADCPGNTFARSESVSTVKGDVQVQEEIIMEGLSEIKNTKEYDKLQLYPNPVKFNSTAEFTLQKKEKISLAIQDLSGKTVQTILKNELKEKGKISVDVDADLLADGIYILLLETDSMRKGLKFIVEK